MTYQFNLKSRENFGFDSLVVDAETWDTFYVGGYYDFFDGNDDFSPGAVSFGTANSPYGAHLLVVQGEALVDEVTLKVSGTSWNDETGVRTAGDDEDIVIGSASPVNSYYQTTKKWIGTVTIQTAGGTAKNFNYGWCEYFNKQKHQFWLKGFRLTCYGDYSSTSGDFVVRHHKATGWTYNAGAAPTPPTPLGRFTTDYSTENDVHDGDHFSWEDQSLSVQIDGHDSEGLIFEVYEGVAGGDRPYIAGNIEYSLSTSA